MTGRGVAEFAKGVEWGIEMITRQNDATKNSIKGITCRSWVNYWWCHGVSCVTRQMYATIADAAARATSLTIFGGLLVVADVAAVVLDVWG